MREVGDRLFSNGDLRRLVGPASIEALLDYSVGIGDSVMVSWAGDAAVSGITLINSLNSVFLFFLSNFAAGGLVLISQYLGAGDKKKAGLTAKQSIWLTGLLGLGIAAILVLFRAPIFSLVFGTVEPAVAEAALSYLTLTALSVPFFGVYKVVCNIFRAVGDSRPAMVTAIGENLINLAGNFIFLSFFDMGAFGVGLATLLARVFGTIFLLCLLVKRRREVGVERLWESELRRGGVREIGEMAVPQGIEGSLTHLAKVAVMRLVATFSTASIAAYGCFCTVCNLLVVIPDGFSAAITPVAGRCIGAGKPEQAEYYTKKILKLSYLSNFVVCGVFYFCMDYIFGLFGLSLEAISIAREMAVVHLVMMALIHPVAYILSGTLKGAGDVKFFSGMAIFSACVVRIAGAYLINFLFPACGVMCVRYATYIEWTFRAVVWIVRYRGGKWKTMSIAA